ncbi:MAG: glycosyltransferase family 4 protein [Candidatus Binatia bacterium]
MRILMLAPTPFFAHRGCHVRILEEVRALGAAGHDIALCTYGLGEDVPGVRTMRSARVPWYRKLTAGPSWHKFYLDALLFATALGATRRFRPDVLHAHLHEGVALALPIARLFGIPLLADLQGSLTVEMSDHGFFARWHWGERLFSRLEGWVSRAPAEVVASAEPLATELAAVRADRGERVTLLGDGVDAESFRRDADARRRVRARLGYGDGEVVVGYLGLLTSYQGVDLLLAIAPRILAAVPHARFLIMGFPNEDLYRERARRAGLGERIRFTGRIRYEEAAAHLSAVDVAVSPKLSATEGNGKLLNYMAMGLPTVAFDTPINRGILGDAGVFARLGDGDDLTGRMIALLGDEARRAALGIELRRRAVEQFSWKTRARQFEAIYRRLRGAAAEPNAPARAAR